MMLTSDSTPSGPRAGTALTEGGSPRRRRPLVALVRAIAFVAVTGALLPVARPDARPSPSQTPAFLAVEQYAAGGTRWMESRNQELVHFVCQPGTPYVISLNSVSLLSAGVLPDDQRAYLEALREAVRDWSERMRCAWIRVEMDHPDPDTRVLFAYIERPGTLAVATRAGDITLNATRAWFPGSKRQGNYTAQRLEVSFYWVVAHELGHVWGVAHSDDPKSLMHPTQCATCRWSSFEQAAANVIHAVSLSADWSRPHDTSRFFVKTPVAAIDPLLTGDLPDETLLAQSPSCEPGICLSREPGPGALPPPPECGLPELLPTSSLVGAPELLRLGRKLLELEQPQRRVVPVAEGAAPRPDPARPFHNPARRDPHAWPLAILPRWRTDPGGDVRPSSKI